MFSQSVGCPHPTLSPEYAGEGWDESGSESQGPWLKFFANQVSN